MSFIKNKKKIIIIGSIIIAVSVVLIITMSNLRNAKPVTASVETTEKVKKGEIKVEISGSGVIQPVQSYEISSLVSGKIISAPFEEGDKVKKDDILYKLDATEVEGNIQKTRNSISRMDLSANDTKSSLDKTVVYAGISGRLTNFNIKENDNVSTAKIGEIIDDSYSVARVPFSESQINKIYVGQSANINSAVLMSSISGTVSRVNSYSSKKANGVALYDVEIKIQGNSSLIRDTEVTAEINGMESPAAGKIEQPEACTVSSSIAGRVKTVYVTNNDYVGEGQRILELESDTYTSSLSKNNLDRNDLMITLSTQEKQLENYNIKAPIDGVVLEKNKKSEDTITAGVNVQPLMTVADMSKVKFEMKIDELDINKIKNGQTVRVTADALPDKEFMGKVTSIAGKGTAANGVSNYLVEVTIDEPGALKPGMNVTAKTIVSEKKDILVVPAAAVWKKDGKAYVTLPKDAEGNSKDTAVELGINNKDYIEIIKGLEENDEIVLPQMAKDSIPKAGQKNNANQEPQGMDAIPK